MTKFLGKLNNPLALIVVVVLFVAFNGFLFYVYGYQQRSLPSVDATQQAAETYHASDESSAEPSTEQEDEVAAEAEETPAAEDALAAEEGATTEEEEANSGEDARTEEGAGPSQEEAAAGTLRTVVSVVDAPTWLSIWVDDEGALEGVIEPGFSRQFEADRETTISTDDAGAVLVDINGYSLGALGTSGEPATRTFSAGA